MCKNISYNDQAEHENPLFYCVLSRKVPEQTKLSPSFTLQRAHDC